MSQLDCISIEYYKEIALPKILSHIKGSKDIMAQQYLLECIIQGIIKYIDKLIFQ